MKYAIPNRDKNILSIVVEGLPHAKKLAFVMHGLGGNKDQLHIRSIVKAFLTNGYTVVTWDAVHSFGESTGGLYDDATVTNYYADMEDVLGWAQDQTWFLKPFVLAGHSLGGICTALYAELHPEKVQALAPISAVISGKLSLRTKADDVDTWKRTGIRTTLSHDGKTVKRLKWSHMEDRLHYDLLKRVDRLTMPVILIVGQNDIVTPAEHQKILFDELPGNKEMHIIPSASHSFYEPEERQELEDVLARWIDKKV